MNTPDLSRPTVRLSVLLATFASLLTAGCRTGSSDVLAHTSTLIGVDISQSTSTQAPKIKAGYAREELAVVPTNRRNSAGKNGTNQLEQNYKNGAKDSANVLMEIHAAGMIESLTFGADIYQRLAVGDIAVRQPGAAFLLARKSNGDLPTEEAKAVRDAVKNATSNLEESQKAGTDLVAGITTEAGKLSDTDLNKVAELAQATDLLNRSSWEQADAESDPTKKLDRKRALLAQRLNGAALDPEHLPQLKQLISLLQRKFPGTDWEK